MYAKLSLLGEYTPQHMRWGNLTKRKGKGFAKKNFSDPRSQEIEEEKEEEEENRDPEIDLNMEYGND